MSIKRVILIVTTCNSSNVSFWLFRSGSLVSSIPDIRTRTEKLSNSVMDPSALNDVEDSDSGIGNVSTPSPMSPPLNQSPPLPPSPPLPFPLSPLL